MATLIEGLSFELGAGQRALITGRNGTGKTSLLRVLAGIAPVTSGEVLLDGVPSGKWSERERAWLAYRGHSDGLKLDLTGRENVEFAASLRGSSAALDDTLSALELRGVIDRPVRQMSAGQRRRVGFAALRASNASVWFLDEPITNLDAEGRDLLAHWLDEHNAAGGMAVIATHNAERLMLPGSVVVEIQEG